MIRPYLIRIFTCLIILGISTQACPAQDAKYKEYQRSSKKKEYFEITYDRRHVEITAPLNGVYKRTRFLHTEIRKHNERVLVDGVVIFDHEGLHLEHELFPFDRICDIHIDKYDDESVMTFYTRTEPDRKVSRVKRGNVIEPIADIVVEEDSFIRGFLFTVIGNIDIQGEVNKDVISLFGDIYVGPEAVVRGDIASVSGRIDASRDASVYGELFSGMHPRGRRHISWRREDELALGSQFAYNRVDGLRSTVQFKYTDPDSLLPTFWIAAGYALESERVRYDIGLEQTILRMPPLSIGGSYYRQLSSEDDWLLSNNENTPFALLVTEDFKDYYEADGGTVYLRLKPIRHLEFEGRYRHEETKWIKAERDLFSLFGGGKVFSYNFGTVDSAFRATGIAEIDSTTNAHLSARLDYDTRDKSDPFSRSAWAVTGIIEWSHPDLDSDFDYRRYTINARRYQKVNRRTMMAVRAMFGGSDGYLPMYKRFYTGGLGTLRGYKHKEYMGTRFWMMNLEYRVDFPKSDLALSILWDVAQIANETKLDDNIEVKHSLGIVAYLGDDFKISLARRLDRSDNDSPQVYVRLDHVL